MLRKILAISLLIFSIFGCDKAPEKVYTFSELAHGYFDIFHAQQAKCTKENQYTNKTCVNARQVLIAIEFSGLGACFKTNNTVDHACVDAIVLKLKKD